MLPLNWATGVIRIVEVWEVLQIKNIIQNIRSFICRRYGVLQRNSNLRVRKVFWMQLIPVQSGMENLRMPIVNWQRFWTVSELFRMI